MCTCISPSPAPTVFLLLPLPFPSFRYVELAVAMYQALLEYNLLDHNYDDGDGGDRGGGSTATFSGARVGRRGGRDMFEEFWESEMPRVGDVGCRRSLWGGGACVGTGGAGAADTGASFRDPLSVALAAALEMGGRPLPPPPAAPSFAPGDDEHSVMPVPVVLAAAVSANGGGGGGDGAEPMMETVMEGPAEPPHIVPRTPADNEAKDAKGLEGQAFMHVKIDVPKKGGDSPTVADESSVLVSLAARLCESDESFRNPRIEMRGTAEHGNEDEEMLSVYSVKHGHRLTLDLESVARLLDGGGSLYRNILSELKGSKGGSSSSSSSSSAEVSSTAAAAVASAARGGEGAEASQAQKRDRVKGKGRGKGEKEKGKMMVAQVIPADDPILHM